MNFRKQIREKGLSSYMVAKYLGVDYAVWKEVERRERGLTGGYIEKFNALINSSKADELKYKFSELSAKAIQMINDGTLNELRIKKNMSLSTIGKILGIKSTSALSKVFCYGYSEHILSQDNIVAIYELLTDPMARNESAYGKHKPRRTKTQIQVSVEQPETEQEKSIEDKTPIEGQLSLFDEQMVDKMETITTMDDSNGLETSDPLLPLKVEASEDSEMKVYTNPNDTLTELRQLRKENEQLRETISAFTKLVGLIK